MNSELLKRLQAVKMLADRGVGGEKENAQALLLRLMEKHSITEEDLDNEERALEYFRFSTKLEERLLSQIIYMTMGVCDRYCQRSKGNNHELKKIGIKCTAAEKIEIIVLYEFYNNAFQKELKLFYSAFIAKNNLYPSPDKERAENSSSAPTEDERLKIEMMMHGIDRYTLRKMLDSGESEDRK